jgi:hypothetical protein
MTDLREQFPAFSQFLRGYLHEDFEEEFGGPFEAAEAFVGDSTDEELAEAMDEAAELLGVLQKDGYGPLMEILHELGRAYQPQSEQELRRLLTILSDTEPGFEDTEDEDER